MPLFKIDLNKVWRVIYDLHLLGESSVLNDAERVLQTNENINFESEDFIVGLIENSFHEDENGFLTCTEILIELEKNTKQNLKSLMKPQKQNYNCGICMTKV